jgi:ureidoglycolate hydrolase
MYMPDESLLEIKEHSESNYKALIFYDKWRVALLNTHERFRRENIYQMERHVETDETFVLLKGAAALYIGDGGSSECGSITMVKMEPLKLYNVKKGVWHNIVTADDTSVLVVENADTAPDNSPKIGIHPDMLPECVF